MLRTMASGLRPLLLTGLALAALPLLDPATPCARGQGRRRRGRQS